MLKKKNIIIFVAIFIVFSVAGVLAYLTSKESEDGQTEILPEKKAETFFISGGENPPFFIKELVIDPAASKTLLNVKEGEKQTYSVWVKDEKGVKRVTAEIYTDKDIVSLEMELSEGLDFEGRWQASWITENISKQKSYKTVFEAENKEGATSILPIIWSVEKD